MLSVFLRGLVTQKSLLRLGALFEARYLPRTHGIATHLLMRLKPLPEIRASTFLQCATRVLRCALCGLLLGTAIGRGH